LKSVVSQARLANRGQQSSIGNGQLEMKILRIIARLNVGGPARHVVWLTQGLKPEGYETLLVAGVVPPGEDDMSYIAAAAGVQPFTLPEMSREISLKDAVTIWKLFRLMRRERPDIVHTHTAKAGTVGRVAGLMYRWLTPAALLGQPRRGSFVHTYHGHVFHSYYGRLKTRLFLGIERFLARFATDRIIVISEQQRREINEVFRVGRREQFAIIPLGIDMSVFALWQSRQTRLRAELNADDDQVLVGIVGRLTEIKNHRLFLQAAAISNLLKKDNASKVRFVIIGDGNLRSDLEEQAKSLRLSEDVSFLGTRNDPEDFYPALDIVALTSLNEGTPLTLIEAMANARPVIATSVGGVVDLLGAAIPDARPDVRKDERVGYQLCERGVSVVSGDPDGFGRGLARLIEDRKLRTEMGARGLEFVTEKYAKERLLRDVSQLYREMTNAGSADVPSALSAQRE
jgi:glycosyltransferase involved in cell wall biosynthesis